MRCSVVDERPAASGALTPPLKANKKLTSFTYGEAAYGRSARQNRAGLFKDRAE